MFGIFITFEHFSKRHSAATATSTASVPANPEVALRLAPAVVAGFEVPANLSYHPGHTWALSESPNLVRVGVDDFAVKLTGKVDNITLPARGTWVRQGQKIWSMMRDGRSVDMVSPIEGSVTEINEAAARNPEIACKDPYGEGWLLKVESPDAKTSFRNLLSGTLARLWTQNAAHRLHTLTPAMAGALAQDGGVAMNDLAAHLPNQDWAKLVKEFFLS
jgi:glycine cleavage system H lipoate-binding protein